MIIQISLSQNSFIFQIWEFTSVSNYSKGMIINIQIKKIVLALNWKNTIESKTEFDEGKYVYKRTVD